MGYKEDEANRRLRIGYPDCHSANNIYEEYEYHLKNIEREEKTRLLEEDNNRLLNVQLVELKEANRRLDLHNEELEDANKKLAIQIDEVRKQSIDSKRHSIISIIIATISVIVAIASFLFSVLK